MTKPTTSQRLQDLDNRLDVIENKLERVEGLLDNFFSAMSILQASVADGTEAARAVAKFFNVPVETLEREHWMIVSKMFENMKG